jgi:hypothetical protein
MEKSRKQTEDGAKSMKVDDGIGNVEVNGEKLGSLDIVGGTSARDAP